MKTKKSGVFSGVFCQWSEICQNETEGRVEVTGKQCSNKKNYEENHNFPANLEIIELN